MSIAKPQARLQRENRWNDLSVIRSLPRREVAARQNRGVLRRLISRFSVKAPVDGSRLFRPAGLW